MGILFLVRHAQASFLDENYDKLSKLGEAQAHLLGEYWARRAITFDRISTGPCIRQQHTAKLVSDAYAAADLNFPGPSVLPEFDEYQAEAVLKQSLPELLDSDASIRNLHSAFQSAVDTQPRRRSFQKLFELVIEKWVRGETSLPDLESWPEFCSRVNSGLTKFLSAGGHRERIAIFTSGGPIAVAVQRALQISPEKTLQVSWMSRNSSWSEFLYSTERFTLGAFNSVSHIDDPAMLTYR